MFIKTDFLQAPDWLLTIFDEQFLMISRKITFLRLTILTRHVFTAKQKTRKLSTVRCLEFMNFHIGHLEPKIYKNFYSKNTIVWFGPHKYRAPFAAQKNHSLFFMLNCDSSRAWQTLIDLFVWYLPFINECLCTCPHKRWLRFGPFEIIQSVHCAIAN